jgi:S1-C subfamily serine protease
MPQPPGGLPGRPNPGRPGGPGVQVRLAVSAGTGSLIDRKNRLVVTNCHVVGDPESVLLYFPEYEKGELVVKREDYKKRPGIPGRVVYREPRIDLALVQLDRLPAGVRVVPLAAKSARPAQQVHSLGNPGASAALWIYSPGKVRQVFRDRWSVFDPFEGKDHVYDGMKLETDSPINPGDSGGPLVNDHGRLVGVAHASDRGAQNFSIFIDVTEVRDLINRYCELLGQRWQPEAP